MFDFENLKVYQRSLDYNKEILTFLKVNSSVDLFLQNQLKRAVTSISLNIAEGTGRKTTPDKRNFYVIASSSVFEVISIMQIIRDNYSVSADFYNRIYSEGSEIYKMLQGLIKSLNINT